MAFDAVRLSDAVERGASGGPKFQTTVIMMGSGREQRNQDWADARGEWNIAYGIDDRKAYTEILSFFRARRGRARGFLFKDWSDYQLTDGPLGLGDGTVKNFQLVKVYEFGGPHPYVRKLTRPVASTVVVRLDGMVQNSGWSLQAGGVVSFAVAPVVGKAVTASCEFDVPVRFDTDQFDIKLEWAEAGEIGGLTIVELRE